MNNKLLLQQHLLEKRNQPAKLCTWIVLQESGFTKFTKAYLEVHQFDAGQVNEENATQICIERIHPDDQARMEAFRNQDLINLPISASYRFQTNIGEYIWLKDTIVRMLPNGEIIGTTQDISDYKFRERQQIASLNFQNKILETTPDIIYIYDTINQRNIFSNRSIYEEIEYTEQDILDLGEKLFETLIHPDDLGRVYQHHGEVLPRLAFHDVAIVQYRMLHRDGKRYVWFESTDSPFEKDAAGNNISILGVARNIDVKKRAELEVMNTNKELESFIYSISHDLRAPVRHISAYSELLSKEEAVLLTPRGDELLDRIAQSADRLGSMIDELLAFYRNRNAVPEKTRIQTEALVRQIFEEFRLQYPDRELELNMEPLPSCSADKAMITQVWENLISNALKYSSKKEKSIIRIACEEQDDGYIFSIHGNGTGFDEKYSSKLFAIFQRLHKKREFPGHGIGLANAARILTLHKGKIWANSTLGEGASFYFTLPK
ncbi:MAG: ATP-binding protein [Bacteroidota bacterium]